MRLHYYGKYDNPESCFSFQEYEIVTQLLRKRPNLGTGGLVEIDERLSRHLLSVK